MSESIYVERLVEGTQPQGYLQIAGSEYGMEKLRDELAAREYAFQRATGGLVVPEPDFVKPTKESK